MKGLGRRLAVTLVATALLGGIVGCSSGEGDSSGTTTAPGGVPATSGAAAGAGMVDAEQWRSRQDGYLDYATQDISPGSALNVLAHLERARRDTTYEPDLSKVTPAAYQEVFDQIDAYEDTTDFDVLYLLNLLYGGGKAVPADLADAIDEHLLKFKYWYTEPTPKGIVDQKWYWSENHRLIFHTDELLAGNRLPDETFQDGRTGAEHAKAAKPMILDWLDEKARFGFSEWHSDVYYQKDVTPLLTLVEFADDPQIEQRAAIVLDLFLLDIAVHLQKGDFAATHGRSYMKDKPVAWEQDTFNLSKLLFDDTSLDYTSTGDAGAVLLARAQCYQLPEAVRQAAISDEPMVDRERMGVPTKADDPWTATPGAPYGYAYDDPDNVPFWWERGALTAWTVAPTTLRTADEYDLWASEFFEPFAAFKALSKSPDEQIEQLAESLSPQIAFGVLDEVNTYTWRGKDASLSTAQDYRPGMRGSQYHAWQATLDEGAVVFTTHPGNEPREGTGSDWKDGDMYWTGTASMPRSAQQGTAAIHIYDPAYEAAESGLLKGFGYLDETHAWFPSERFDEVVRAGNWTFGRKGDGYVALWSWRPVTWRQHDPAKVPTGGLTKDFDLVAAGGARNVWAVEVGDGSRWKSFEAFRTAMSAADPKVTQVTDGFAVTWASPEEGALSFGSKGPLTVDGKRVALDDYPRMDNPYATVPFQGRDVVVKAGGATLTLDTKAWERSATSGS